MFRIVKYKISNFSNYSNKKYYHFTSNFVDDRDFSNFMRGLDKGGTGQRGDWTKGNWTKGFTVITEK